MTATSIIGDEPSIATDVVVIGATIGGAYAHRRVMKDIKIGERFIPAYKVGDLSFPERVEPILMYVQTAGCLDTKGTPMSWGWARHNGATLCPDCWEMGYGADYDSGPPAFQLAEQVLAPDGTIPDPPPPIAPTDAELRRDAIAAEEPPMWDEEWGPAEPPPDDDYIPPAEWTEPPPPPTAAWDYYSRNGKIGDRTIERGPELP